MKQKLTFAEQVLQFNDYLSKEMFNLPANYKIVNPFNGLQKEKVNQIANAFYIKYYNDYHPRRLILGSSPSRRGSAIIGVPFENANYLQSETGIIVDKFSIREFSKIKVTIINWDME